MRLSCPLFVAEIRLRNMTVRAQASLFRAILVPHMDKLWRTIEFFHRAERLVGNSEECWSALRDSHPY